MSKSFALLSLSALLLTCVSVGAKAQSAENIGTFGDWSAYKYMQDGKAICYMSAKPFKDEGKYTKRDPIHALVTHNTADGTKNTFNYVAGYTYKQGSDVTVTIDGQSFTLFTHGDRAWAPDQTTDDALTSALQKGSKMVVKGTSGRGNLTTDSFSLKGSGDAYAAISKECGV